MGRCRVPVRSGTVLALGFSVTSDWINDGGTLQMIERTYAPCPRITNQSCAINGSDTNSLRAATTLTIHICTSTRSSETDGNVSSLFLQKNRALDSTEPFATCLVSFTFVSSV